MNTTRLIWISTTVLFALVGALLGRWVGEFYINAFDDRLFSLLVGKPLGTIVVATISLGTAIVAARFGSWVGERFLARSLREFQNLSAVDRLLSIAGALIGLVFGVLITLPLFTLPNKTLWLPVQFCIMATTSALGMALLQGMRAEMVRVLPQLEADDLRARDASTSTPKLLDTNVIIDGRMADICKTGFIDGPIYVPFFVLHEVQYIADSADAMRRGRGRRGLEILNAMRDIAVEQTRNGQVQTMPLVQVLTEVSAAVQKIETVDAKLVGLAKEMGAAIVTNDYNLNRVAELQGVSVLNLNQLVQALKPVVLPGEEMNLTVVKAGKEAGQGIGYLEDGTMIVVSDGARHVGETCKVTISSMHQTVAGKMFFADIKGLKGAGDDLFDDNGLSGANKRSHDDDLHARAGGGLRRKNKA